MTKTITRVYSDYASAELAVRELKAAGLGDIRPGVIRQCPLCAKSGRWRTTPTN